MNNASNSRVMDWADPGNIVDTVFAPGGSFQYTFWGVTAPEQADEFQALGRSNIADHNRSVM